MGENPVKSLYTGIMATQGLVWISAIIAFSMSAVIVSNTPSGDPLRIAAIYNLAAVCLVQQYSDHALG